MFFIVFFSKTVLEDWLQPKLYQLVVTRCVNLRSFALFAFSFLGLFAAICGHLALYHTACHKKPVFWREMTSFLYSFYIVLI